MTPEDRAALRIEGEDIVLAGDSIQHPRMDQGLRLGGMVGFSARPQQMRAPQGLEAGDIVAADPLQWGISLIV
jgi:hypothetical protein